MPAINGMILDPRMLQYLQQQQQSKMQQSRVAGPPAPSQPTAPLATEPASTGQPDAPVADPSTIAPAAIPDRTPEDDGWKFEREGVYKKQVGDYTYDIDAADVPPDVAAYAMKKFPAPGVISASGRTFKIGDDGSVSERLPEGIWGKMSDDVVGTLPEEVRKPYVEAKSKSDKSFGEQIFTKPMSGNVTANQDQIEQQKQNIRGISDALSEDSQLKGIYSPETLDAARAQAATTLEAAKGSGDKATIEAATKRVQELKDMHIIATPEGGYMTLVKNPFGNGFDVVHTATPKEPKKSGQYDWTQDPMQMQRAGTALAEQQNRMTSAQQTNNTMLNANAQRLVQDYIGPYAQYYRSQQLAGNPLGHKTPEEMVGKLVKQMKDDPNGAIATIAEMQKSLAEVYGKGYMAITPGVHAPTMFNDGNMDKMTAIIPEQPQRGYTSTTQMVQDPKAKAAKDMKEAPFALPNYQGKMDVAANATQSIRDNAPVDQNRTKGMMDQHEDLIYNQAGAPIKNYRVPGRDGKIETRPDAADKNTAFDQWVQGKLMQKGGNNEFKKKYAETMVTALEQTAASIALKAQQTGVTETDREDDQGNPLGTSTKAKAPMLDTASKDKAMKEIFGSAKSPFIVEEIVTKADPTDPTGKKMIKEKVKRHQDWSEPGVVRKWSESILNRTKTAGSGRELQYPNVHTAQPSAAAKTLHLIEGVAAGRNGHIEIDTRLRDASSHILNGMQGLLASEADEFIKENRGYFEENLRKGTGDNYYRPEEVYNAAKSTLISQMLWKQMGMILNQPK